LGDELAVRPERILILVARVQPKRQLEFGFALLLSSQPDYERAKVTGPSVAHLLPRECGASLKSDKYIANFVGAIRLYKDNGKPGFLECLLQVLG
jgi:hypothetical protein